jgi:hypothetical protein
MASQCAFDYAQPFDILVGYWVGSASIYGPKGVYVMSTKSFVSVYWEKRYQKLSFRESAEDEFGFTGPESEYLDTRQVSEAVIAAQISSAAPLADSSGALRILTFDLDVIGPYCTGQTGPVSLDGRQTRPDAYQFHLQKKEENGQTHHIYNSHHLPSPDDWHIIGPIVGPIKGIEGQVGLAVTQFFRRISYHVPRVTVRRLK